MAKKTHARVMESLKKLGGKQGFLTYDQINDYLDEDASLEEMDEIYASLGKLKVDVVDSVEEGRQRLERRKARKKPAEAIVAQQPVRFDDPVRMYLREMGRVPLLDRQGEIEIAKRIEQGQDMVLQTVFRSASSVRELALLGLKVDKGRMSLEEFVRVDTGGFGPSGQPPQGGEVEGATACARSSARTPSWSGWARRCRARRGRRSSARTTTRSAPDTARASTKSCTI
jgi:hypothetical protein